METTWDGLPVAAEPPFAVSVVVWRDVEGAREFLLLHRRLAGVDEGEWAWTSPAGARQPGEDASAAARRELSEETGLTLPLVGPLEHVTHDVALFTAEAPDGVRIALDAEHDRFEWVSLEEGIRRCLPAVVGEALRIADREARALPGHEHTSGR